MSADLIVISQDWSFLKFPTTKINNGITKHLYYIFYRFEIDFVFTLNCDGWIRRYFRRGRSTG